MERSLRSTSDEHYFVRFIPFEPRVLVTLLQRCFSLALSSNFRSRTYPTEAGAEA